MMAATPLTTSVKRRVREFSNLIVLLERCRAIPRAIQAELARWRAELQEARDALERLAIDRQESDERQAEGNSTHVRG